MKKLPPKAIKNHGPCDNCGDDIEVGQTYIRHLRPATAEEQQNESIRTWRAYGTRVRSVKQHTSCAKKTYGSTSSLGSLLP